MDNDGQITKEEEKNNDSNLVETKNEDIESNWTYADEESENVNKTNLGTKILKGSLLLLVSIGILIGGVLVGMKGYEYFEAQSKKKDIPLDTVLEKQDENDVTVKKSLDEIYNDVHVMANTLIVAEDDFIWGVNPINKETLKTAILLVEGVDEYLSEELNKWTNLDFSNGVEVHNYVWKKLGGTVGRAVSLNVDGIEKAKEALWE